LQVHTARYDNEHRMDGYKQVQKSQGVTKVPKCRNKANKFT